MLFGTMTTGVFAAENGASKNTSADKFTPKVTYQVTVTDAERAKIHAAVDTLIISAVTSATWSSAIRATIPTP